MKRHLIYLIIGLIILLQSCKKSIQERKIEGIWEVKYFIVNGIDSTSYVKYPDIKGYRFEYDNSRDSDYSFQYLYEVNVKNEEIIFGHWGERKKNKIFLGVEYKSENTGPFYSRHYYKYFDIEFIKRKEMKFSLIDNDLKYEIEFAKIK